MALIQDYISLQSAVIEYLARDQDTTLTTRIPTFIQLFEAKMNRELYVRQMESRATALTDNTLAEPQFIALPSDFQSMRRMRISSGAQSTYKTTLDFKSTVQMDEYRDLNANVSGQPQYFSIFGNEIELAPTPDAAYTIEMIYRANLPALASNSTNWLLTLAPDAYLYGALLESAPYLKEDSRIQTWALGYKAAVDGLNNLGNMSAYNAGPLVVRASGLNVW